MGQRSRSSRLLPSAGGAGKGWRLVGFPSVGFLWVLLLIWQVPLPSIFAR